MLLMVLFFGILLTTLYQPLSCQAREQFREFDTHDIYSIGNIETTLENLQRNRFESQERY